MPLCPCHSDKEYSECCKPYHDGLPAPTPLILMRSRYSAYALNKALYIIETTHPRSPHFERDRKKWIQSILEFCNTTEFLNLQILGCQEDWVHFRATLKQNEEFILEEKSLFQKVDKKWYYLKALAK